MQKNAYNIVIEQSTGDRTEHTVEVRNADRLQAEMSGRGHGILVGLQDAPLTWATLWIYHACVREGLFSGKWQEFKTALIDFDEAGSGDEVPPTSEAELMSSVSS